MRQTWTRLDLVKQGRYEPRESEFTVLDIETTALAPPGRVIEIGAVRMRGDGHILGEFSTLVHPGHGVDLGASWVHRIYPEHIEGAPLMREVIGDLLAFMQGSVLVAHNADFEERFLLHEFGLLGVAAQGQYSLCTLRASQTHFRQLANHKLLTVSEAFRLPNKPDHSALEDARTCAHLLATFLDYPYSFGLSARPQIAELPRRPTVLRPLQPRVRGLRRGEDGWLASLMQRLPMSAPGTTHPDIAERYAELLSEALADQRIVGDEAKELARFASRSGMARADVQKVHHAMLDGMREVAEADGMIDDDEREQLSQMARLLGSPGYFENLSRSLAQQQSRPTREKAGSAPAVVRPRTKSPEPSHGPWADRRVLFLTSGERTVLLQELLVERGARIAKILTDSVTHVVAEPSSADPRVERAQQKQLPVLSPLDIQRWFLEPTPIAQKPLATPQPVTPVSATSEPPKSNAEPHPFDDALRPQLQSIPTTQPAWHYPQTATLPPAQAAVPQAPKASSWWAVLAVFPLLLGGLCCLGGFGTLLDHKFGAAFFGIISGFLLVGLAGKLFLRTVPSTQQRNPSPPRP